MTKIESDICIIGGGISAAMLAEKLSELKPGKSIAIVEGGKRLFDLENRFRNRQRNLDYGENAWPEDFIPDQAAKGVISRTMAVGGSAMHWGGTCNRFSQEDLRLKSMFGLHVDWPLEWNELERYYCEAEDRLGVSGEPSPLPEDRMSKPYPMAAIPLTYNLLELQKWGNKSGIPFWATPQAKNLVPRNGRAACIRCNTCLVCPTGARYSPDFTFKQLIAAKKIKLYDQTLIRRLVLHDANQANRGCGGRKPGPARRDRPLRSAPVRACVRLLLESSSSLAFSVLAVSERACKQLRPGGPLHVRPLLHPELHGSERPGVSRHV